MMAMFREVEPDSQPEFQKNSREVRKLHLDIQVLMLARALGEKRDPPAELEWVEKYSEAFSKYMDENLHLYHAYTLEPLPAIEQIEKALYGESGMRDAA